MYMTLPLQDEDILITIPIDGLDRIVFSFMQEEGGGQRPSQISEKASCLPG